MGATMAIKLNHIGFVVENIAKTAKLFCTLGLREVTGAERDPVQRVIACFMGTGDEGEAHIELLEPAGEDSPITRFLKKRGGGLHHICFEVDDINRMTDDLVQKGFKVVVPPVDCVGYDRSFNRESRGVTKIAFFFLSEKILIELLQKG
jgi:methylmalonyl-CoA/ethylmalonyl-CoA epimerase